MNTMLKNISAILRKACFTAIAVAALAASTQSASADVTIEFSPHPTDAKVTKVVLNFDSTGLTPTDQASLDWSEIRMARVLSTEHGNVAARSFLMRGNPAQSKKVVYLETGGKATKVEIFHKDLRIEEHDAGSGFSWAVGDGYFAIDQTEIDKKSHESTFYIRKPIAEVIVADALGKTITNGKVTIKSTK